MLAKQLGLISQADLLHWGLGFSLFGSCIGFGRALPAKLCAGAPLFWFSCLSVERTGGRDVGFRLCRAVLVCSVASRVDWASGLH